MYVPYYSQSNKKWEYHSITNFKIGSTRQYLNEDGTFNGTTGADLLAFTPFIADISNVTDYRPCGNLTTI